MMITLSRNTMVNHKIKTKQSNKHATILPYHDGLPDYAGKVKYLSPEI